VRETIAYIPARAGSKRIPLKNIRELGGRPVLAHVIEHLRELEFLKGIGVSTDSHEIAKIAQDYGATVLDLRGRDLSNDYADFKDLLKQDIGRYLTHFKVKPENANVLFAVPTAALIKPETYRRAYAVFNKMNANLLFSTIPYSISPYWALTEKEAGTWKPLFPEQLRMRSQDLPKTQADATLFYFLRFQEMTAEQRHWFLVRDGMVCFPVDPSVAIDVDTVEDWKELESKYKNIKRLS
jgi:CMP-N-acetylneuraminic acid synthetase